MEEAFKSMPPLEGILELTDLHGKPLPSIVGKDGVTYWVATPNQQYRVRAHLAGVRDFLEPRQYEADCIAMRLFVDGEMTCYTGCAKNEPILGSFCTGRGKIFELRFAPTERIPGELTPEAFRECKKISDTGIVEAAFSYCPERHELVYERIKAPKLAKPPTFVGTWKVATKGNKFYEAAAVGSKLVPNRPLEATVIANCAHQMLPVCRAVLHYDTAENMHLRRLLDPTNPAHVPFIPPAESVLGARPASEALVEEFIDLTGDEEEVCTSVQKKRKVEEKPDEGPSSYSGCIVA